MQWEQEELCDCHSMAYTTNGGPFHSYDALVRLASRSNHILTRPTIVCGKDIGDLTCEKVSASLKQIRKH